MITDILYYIDKGNTVSFFKYKNIFGHYSYDVIIYTKRNAYTIINVHNTIDIHIIKSLLSVFETI